jgi:hypothetical protein
MVKSRGHSFCGPSDAAADGDGNEDGFFPTVFMASVHMAAVGDWIGAEVEVEVDVESGFIVIGL